MKNSRFLTPREKEILQLVARGWTNQQIAQYLTISPKTVETHLQNVYRKLRVCNRTEAVAYFFKHGNSLGKNP